MNNGGYLAIQNTQKKYFDGRLVGSKEPDLTLPSLKKIADVYDLKYYLLENEKDVQSICKQVLAGQEPCLVDVIESDQQETVMRVETRMVDGKPVSMRFDEV